MPQARRTEFSDAIALLAVERAGIHGAPRGNAAGTRSFLEPLAAAGIDAFHCSTRRFWEPEFEGSDLNLAGWTKKLTGKPTITVGSVSLDVDFMVSLGRMAAPKTALSDGNGAGRDAHIDRLLEMLARGDFDLVAVGRAMLSDPRWAAKVRDSRFAELNPFTPEVLKTLV